MTETSRRERAERIRELLATESDAIAANTQGFNQGRYDAVADLDDYEATKQQARDIKEAAIEDLPALIDELTASIEANGGQVHRASDTADANAIITDIVSDTTADTVMKSKSMTSEEIEINDTLTTHGVDVWETDLGEFVIQLADEEPSHIVAPAIHRSREEITDLFMEYFDLDTRPDTAEALVAIARDFLGDQIQAADIGMTGANFLVADTGTLALVTSEGNARKCVADTDVHIAIAGVEKIIPTVTDLEPFIELLARSSTGQDLTSYLTFYTPPGTAPTLDGDTLAEDDREFHLVLLDNGRMAMRDDPDLRETLYCIRCSACLNSCANFQHVGGHAFGGETYSGGIGTAWEAGVESLDSAGSFGDLCTGCSRCVNQCPVNIDIPWLNEVIRDRVNRQETQNLDWVYDGLTPDEEPGGLDRPKRFFGNFETIAKLGSRTAPVSNWLTNRSLVRTVADKWVGIDRRRQLPTFERETFTDWFHRRGPQVTRDAADREAVIYPDVYTNYIEVTRGKAAVRTLEALDVHVTVPSVPESGRAPLSQGMIQTARRQATDTIDALTEAVDAGKDVVVIEPSDLAMFRRDYDHLVEENPLKDTSFELFEYLYGLFENGADATAVQDPMAARTNRIAYHAHCQQRTLGLAVYTEAVLDSIGFDVATSEVECCGMAGSFGYKSEYYELSMAVGEELAEQFSAEAMQDRLVVASGTSCLDQLDALLSRTSMHPIMLVDPGQ